MDKYEAVKDLGAGNFGVARLMRNKETKDATSYGYGLQKRGFKIEN